MRAETLRLCDRGTIKIISTPAVSLGSHPLPEFDVNIADRRGGGRGTWGTRELCIAVIKHVGTEALPAAASGCNYQRGPK